MPSLRALRHRARLCVVALAAIAITLLNVGPLAGIASATPVGVPDAPAAPTATRGNTTLSVAFDTNVNANGGTIDTFTASCSLQAGGDTHTNSGATSPIVVSGLTNGSTYVCQVRAHNESGNGSYSSNSNTVIPATRPSKMADPVAAHAGRGKLSVSFTPLTHPAGDGGLPVIGYRTTCNNSPDDGVGAAANGTSSPIVVSGLTNGAHYNCYIIAINAVGGSPGSDASNQIQVLDVPSAPIIDSASQGAVSATVAFHDGADNGGADPTSYTASCSLDGGGGTHTNTGANSPITVSGLTNGSSYVCKVKATNDAGDGPYSADSSTVTPTDVPAAPVKPTVTNPGPRLLRVTIASAPADNAATITAFHASCVSNDGGDPVSASNDGVGLSIDVAGAIRGTHYTCTMTAENAVGTSEPSPASDAVVVNNYDPPDPPTITGVERGGSGEIDVSYNAPVYQGGGPTQLDGYEVSCAADEIGASGSATDTASPTTVSGLTNGSAYACRVRAHNDAGYYSEYSEPSELIVAGTAPATPDISAIEGDDGYIVATVDVSDDGGLPVWGWYLQCSTDDFDHYNTAFSFWSPIGYNGISNGATYICRAAVANDAGISSYSASSDPVIPGAVPDPPTIVMPIADVENHGEILAFTDGDGHGLDPLSATATCTSTDGGTTRSATKNAPLGGQIDVQNLDKNHQYTCTLYETNVKGDGEPATPVDPLYSFYVPDAPDQPGIQSIDGGVRVSISSAADNGWDITSWRATCESSDGGAGPEHADSVHADDEYVDVTGLTNGKQYQCALNATNAWGASDESIPSHIVVPNVAPAAPTIGSPDTVGHPSAVSVAFTPGVNNGTDATFTADCASSDGGTERTNTGASSPIVVSSLSAGKHYTCKVSATNDAGTSAFSADSDEFLATGYPDAPAKPAVAHHAGYGDITVSWDAPDDGGDPIIGYNLNCESSDGGYGDGLTVGADETSAVMEWLSIGNTYTCTVSAVNGVGGGEPSEASDPIVAASAPTGKPTAVTAAPANADAATVEFTPIDDEDNGSSPISGYTATCESSDGGDTATASIGADDGNVITVTELSHLKTYTCSVHGTNDVSDSDESDASSSFVAVTVPDAPAQPSVVLGDNQGEVVVTVSAPADGGATIDSYTATCVSNDGGTTRTASHATPAVTVTALTLAKTYTCTMTAHNAVGDGEGAPESAAIVIDSPVNSAVPAITGSAIDQRTLTSTTGTWSGLPSPSYTRQWRRCNSAGSSCVNITGATGTTYVLTKNDVDKTIRVDVTATNSAGSGTATSAATAVVAALPASVSGPYYYDGSAVRKAGPFVVGIATHGSKVWQVLPNGDLLSGPNYGTMRGWRLNKPVVGIVATPSGNGYWMFAADGGIFGFGDAHYYGGAGSWHLNAPIVSMAATPDGGGYWLFGADGGVFGFGNARYHGSTGNQHLSSRAVAMLSTPSGNGYWIVTADGRAIRFGDASNIGSVTSLHRTDIVGIVSTGAGYRFVTKTLTLLTPVV